MDFEIKNILIFVINLKYVPLEDVFPFLSYNCQFENGIFRFIMIPHKRGNRRSSFIFLEPVNWLKLNLLAIYIASFIFLLITFNVFFEDSIDSWKHFLTSWCVSFAKEALRAQGNSCKNLVRYIKILEET